MTRVLGRGRQRLAIASAAVMLVVLAACGDATSPDATTSSAASETSPAPATSEPTPAGACAPACGPTTSTTPPTTAGDPLPGATTDAKVSDGTGRGNLTAIRIAAQPGFDRVVFEFDGSIPGYDVRYIDPPAFMDGSGEPVAVAGGAILQARFYPASSYDLEAGAPTYTRRRLAGTGGAVAEVVFNGDFEAVLRWAVGTNPGALPFTVSALSDPSRIVIDVAR